ncbi:MAG: hypothetical protein WA948_12700 [Pontixanthobacter sp.]
MKLAKPFDAIRALAQVPSGRRTMSQDGLIWNHIHYRFNGGGISRALSNNFHKTPFARRLKGGATIQVTIRVWEGDIDKIEALDDTTGEWIPMWSTNPDYTGGLSRWEHDQYLRMLESQIGSLDADLRNAGGFERAILAVKARQLGEFDDERPKLTLSGSVRPTALAECEERRINESEQAADSAVAAIATSTQESVDRSRGVKNMRFNNCVNPDVGKREDAVSVNGPTKSYCFDQHPESGANGSGSNIIRSPLRKTEPSRGYVRPDSDREDCPKPPPQPVPKNKKQVKKNTEKRPADWGMASTAHLTRPGSSEDDGGINDGNDINDTNTAAQGEETGSNQNNKKVDNDDQLRTFSLNKGRNAWPKEE